MHGADDEGFLMQERCWYGLLCATITKRRNVAATREVDGNQIGCAQAGIILLKRPSQPPSLNPHDRIGLRVEVLPPSERLDGNRVAFDASPPRHAMSPRRRTEEKRQVAATSGTY